MQFRNMCYSLAITLAALSLQLTKADDSHTTTAAGSIRGITRDPCGHSVAAVSVTVYTVGENAGQTVVSGSDGTFLIENVKPGKYQLSARAEGFETSSSTTVDVTDQQTAIVDVPLTNNVIPSKNVSAASKPGFFKRFAMAYRTDWHPAPVTAAATAAPNAEPSLQRVSAASIQSSVSFQRLANWRHALDRLP